MSSHLRSVWDPKSNELKVTLKGHDSAVSAVCVTLNGKSIICELLEPG